MEPKKRKAPRLAKALGLLVLIGCIAPGDSSALFGRKKIDVFAAAHEAKTKEYAANKTAHAPVHAGQCSKCHADKKDPGKLLQEAKPLCLSCHSERAADLKKASVHVPFKEMECGTCHQSHSSENPPLLNAPVKELCAGCHDLGSDPIKSSHFGITRFDGDCTQCHSPHGSKNPKLILEAKEHIPFGSRSCEMCHAATGTDGKPALKKVPEETCFLCHSNFRRLGENPVVHMPFASGECALCHNPHVSKRAALIKKPMHGICFNCHDGEIKNSHPSSRHPTERDGVPDPRREGKPFNCASCHEAHAGKVAGLLRKDFFILCSECHKR